MTVFAIGTAVVTGCLFFGGLNWIAIAGIAVVGCAYALTDGDDRD